MTHICASKLTIIGSDNGLSPGRHQAIIWINAGILLIWPLGTNFSEILIEIYIVSFMNMHLKLSSGIWRPFCLGLNVLIWYNLQIWLKQCNIRFHWIRPYSNFVRFCSFHWCWTNFTSLKIEPIKTFETDKGSLIKPECLGTYQEQFTSPDYLVEVRCLPNEKHCSNQYRAPHTINKVYNIVKRTYYGIYYFWLFIRC